MRVAAWVVYDGVLPLGPDFIVDITRTWKGLATGAFASSGLFDALGERIPGDTTANKQGFIIETLETSTELVSGFVADKGLTQQGVMDQLQGLSGLGAGGMDVAAAAIDASTRITAHTGTQTVARALARAGRRELQDKVWSDCVASLR